MLREKIKLILGQTHANIYDNFFLLTFCSLDPPYSLYNMAININISEKSQKYRFD